MTSDAEVKMPATELKVTQRPLERRTGYSTGGIVCGEQIRAARAMLKLKRDKLASSAGIHPNAVKYWEARRIPHGERPYAVACIAHALRQHGIEAFSKPAPGVRFVPE